MTQHELWPDDSDDTPAKGSGGLNKTKISWTNLTWNVWHGCSHVGDDCLNCYAETLSHRYGHTALPWIHENVAENVSIKEHKFRYPSRVKEPSMIFVNSMSDVFHPYIGDKWIDKLFEAMHAAPQHIYQILTKRPARAAAWKHGWAANIWLGTSVGGHKFIPRVNQLRKSNAPVKFISYEPAIARLGPGINLDGFDWLIFGGESGKGFRPMEMAWAREARDACVEQGVAFFYKQSASYRSEQHPYLIEEDGTKWEWHQFPGNRVPPKKLGGLT